MSEKLSDIEIEGPELERIEAAIAQAESEPRVRLSAIKTRYLGKMPNCAKDVRSDIAFLLETIDVLVTVSKGLYTGAEPATAPEDWDANREISDDDKRAAIRDGMRELGAPLEDEDPTTPLSMTPLKDPTD